jgi:formylglycine-generating enzyme required for sulfatase activity
VAVKQQEPAIERLVEVKKNKGKYVSTVGEQRILWTLREVLTDPERIGQYDVEGTIAQGDFDLRAEGLAMVEQLNRYVVQQDWGAADRQIAEMKRKAEAGTVDRGVVSLYVKKFGELRAAPDRKWPSEARKLAFVNAYGQDLYGYWFDLRAGGTTQRFRYIAPGKFIMGSAKEEWGRLPGEPLLEETIVGKGYWMMEAEVTQELWEGVMGADANRSKFRGSKLPVENVSYAHAVNFAGRLGVDARLPTEVEWEYACRAGSRYMYSGTGRLSDHAWFWDEKKDVIGAESVRIVHELDAEVTGDSRSTHEVKGKLPNAWGLYDMQGNVWEWCKESPVTGAVLVKDFHPVRGGSWTSIPQSCRAARAAWFDVEHQAWNVGFRVVISADGK